MYWHPEFILTLKFTLQFSVVCLKFVTHIHHSSALKPALLTVDAFKVLCRYNQSSILVKEINDIMKQASIIFYRNNLYKLFNFFFSFAELSSSEVNSLEN